MVSVIQVWLLASVASLATPEVTADEVVEKGLKAAEAAFAKKDDKKGVEILDQTLATIAKDGKVRLEEEISPLYHLRGHAHLRLKQDDKASNDFRETVKLEPKNVRYLNQAAWQLATSTSENARDGKTAVEYAEKAVKLVKADQDIQGAQESYLLTLYLDTLAAAHAEAGDFKLALRSQQKSIDAWDETTSPEGKLGLLLFFKAVYTANVKEEFQRTGKMPSKDTLKQWDMEIEQQYKSFLEMSEQLKARRELYRESKPYREKR